MVRLRRSFEQNAAPRSSLADHVPIPPPMKVLLSIGIYFCLVLALGFVMALTLPREGYEQEVPDDEL